MTFFDLPDEIFVEILRYLNVLDMYHLSVTCNRMNNLFKNKVVKEIVKEYIMRASKPFVFMDVRIHSLDKTGKLVFLLHRDIVPKTADNFFQLCCHTQGFGYKGSTFHRVIPEFMMQGGDFTRHNGTGGKSIYGDKFPDENWQLKHSKYSLSMANAGPNTNGSQFFCCFIKCPWLDKKHCVFGRLVHGYEWFKQIEKHGSSGSGKPKGKMTIEDCGAMSWYNKKDHDILQEVMNDEEVVKELQLRPTDKTLEKNAKFVLKPPPVGKKLPKPGKDGGSENGGKKSGGWFSSLFN